MTTKNAQTVLIGALIFSIAMVSLSFESAFAEKIDTLVTEYENVANENLNAMQEKEIKQKAIDVEKIKSTPDTFKLTKLQQEIDVLDSKIKTTETKLSQIQEKATEILTIEPQLKERLDTARDIIYENQDLVPWGGLGVSQSLKALNIVIDEENASEKYLPIVEKLIGSDIPVVIEEGKTEFMSCSSRFVDCSYLQGGIAISDDPTWDCTLGFAVKKGTTYGFITAGHCFPNSTDIYQPDTTHGLIGTVTQRFFDTTCDCEFITMNALDVWDEKVYSGPNTDWALTSKATPSSTAIISFSGAASNIVDWGNVDSTNWSCSDGMGTTVNGLYRTSNTAVSGGDSGAPVFDSTTGVKKFYGTVSCRESTTDDDMVFEPWGTIATKLGVS